MALSGVAAANGVHDNAPVLPTRALLWLIASFAVLLFPPMGSATHLAGGHLWCACRLALYGTKRSCQAPR